jgi:hypothetical protein
MMAKWACRDHDEAHGETLRYCLDWQKEAFINIFKTPGQAI